MRLKQLLINTLFPPSCLGCEKSGTWLCEFCAALITPTPTQHCYQCRKISALGRTCDEHPRKTSTLDRVLIACHYDANPLLHRTLRAFKYEGKFFGIVERFGQLLKSTLPSALKNSLVVIPVPLHRKKETERGFNQALMLGKMLSFPLISDLLIRKKYTPSQVALTPEKRKENVRDVFELQKNPDPRHTYLLIDDIMTTGATLENCCKALKEAGIKEVWGLVLGRN